jgi:ElaB protein
MKKTTRRYQKTAVNELNALLASSEDLLESLGDQSGEAAEKLRERLTASVAKTKQRLGNAADTASSAAQDAADSAQSYVTQNPWTALAIGTIAGVAIGALVTSGFGKRFR